MKGKYVPGAFTLRVGRSSAGLGLYATETLPKGACIIEYVGRRITPEEEDTTQIGLQTQQRYGLTDHAGTDNNRVRPQGTDPDLPHLKNSPETAETGLDEDHFQKKS